jgi:tRNA(Ile)-lysidine synthase
MALLDLVHRAAARCGFLVVAAHLNHRLRGGESDLDQELVEREGRGRGIRVVVGSLPNGWQDSLSGESWEMAARRLRREYLRREAEEAGAARVLLGHTADDLAETVLLRLLRGTGPDGLAGIPPLTDGLFAHPLLPFTRKEVMDHLAWSGTPWREDATNGGTATGRGSVRWGLLPLMRQSNPSLNDALVRLAGQALEDREFFAAQVDRAWSDAVAGDPPVLSLTVLGGLPAPIARRLLQRYLALVAGGAVPSTVVAEALCAAKIPGSAPRIRLPGGIVLEKERETFRPAVPETGDGTED